MNGQSGRGMGEGILIYTKGHITMVLCQSFKNERNKKLKSSPTGLSLIESSYAFPIFFHKAGDPVLGSSNVILTEVEDGIYAFTLSV